MKIGSSPHFLGIGILIMFTFFCGFTNIKLADVETALIEKDYAKAGDLAQSIYDNNPSRMEKDQALYYMGLSQLGLEQYSRARDSFQHLLKHSLDKKLVDKAHLGVIDSYLLDEKYSDALDEAKKLLRRNPRSEYLSLIYLKLARANLKLTRWTEAQGFLKKIIDQYPDSPETHVAQQLLEERQYFSVQLGAFLDQAHAENLIDELKQKNEYAYIVETTDKEGRKFYRVRIGQLTTLDEARELKSELSQQGYPTLIYP